ncbi:uncharacterized protein LOC106762287 [Vigna radiata var. radiata]|uniref:Uncharacterized protein LOC106762287 n=1 Tax=Vigna radiata var. radiata TaxID=3916 RepID=A0A1S3U6F3_VIGRR|nr:uncharacterized protein LOC106762287 [Vigna radiata var. radiata]
MSRRRLRPYFQGHQVVVRTDYPIAKILRKPDLARRMISWSVELSEFGLKFKPRGSVRGQHLADFASELSSEPEVYWWQLSVDGSSNKRGGGAGIVLEGPNGILVEQSLVFQFKVSNNQAEYEALIAGLELARDLGASCLECQTDSQLVEGQVKGAFQLKDDQLMQYFNKLKKLEATFAHFQLQYVPRSENGRADRLAKLASGNVRGDCQQQSGREWGITPVTISVEHPQTNGQAEAINKIIVNELKKRLREAKGTWVEELPQVLWGYRCSPHGATGESPFTLTYGTDAMLQVEMGEVTLRRNMGDMSLNDDRLRENLDVLQERREVAAVRVEAQKRGLGLEEGGSGQERGESWKADGELGGTVQGLGELEQWSISLEASGWKTDL